MRTPWIAWGLSVFLIITAILRMVKGYSVPPLVVASFSVIAVLTSISDLLEVLKTRKKYQSLVLFFALIFLIIALCFWVFPLDLDEKIAQKIGDGFTILGLASVIGIFGFKERKTSTAEVAEPLTNLDFTMTHREYEEMLKLNDVIEQLKDLTMETFPYSRVHDGWALFYDTIAEYWNRLKSPFYDGLNRKMYYDFLQALNTATESIGGIADTDYRTFRHNKIKMWNEEIQVTTQPKLNSPYVPTINDVNTELNIALDEWEKLKKQITQRYERERAQK